MNYPRPGVDYSAVLKPSNLPRHTVEEYAESVASKAGFAPGWALTEVVALFGGRVHYENMRKWTPQDGSIYVHGRCDFDIILPLHTSPRRDRFTIGHELGHYFLHANQGELPLIAYRQLQSVRAEWEANWFAAALLMPRTPFLDELANSGDLAEVARCFDVSLQAATVREQVLRRAA